MNKSYRTIWNEALGSWVAASENAAARGKRNKAKVCAVVATAVVAAASWAPVAHAQYNAGGGVAKGSKSIAIGSGATTDGSQDGNIAIGDKASANSGTSANAYSATAIGLDATAAGDGTVALGDAASATADRATAIGRFAHADGVKSSALGSNAYAFELGSTAVGAESFASAQGATALGFTSVAAGQNSVAVGFGATSIGDAGIAIGQLANSKGNASLAMGTYASSTGDSSTAIGLEARSEGDWSTALGYQAYTAGIRSTALGNQSFSEGKGSTALGDRTKSTGDWSAAVGSYAESAGINSAAVGALASSSGDFSAAVGSNARSEGYGSIALGLNSSALEDRSVALGAGSIADRGDAVSVGNATLKRQITNMAAGTLSDSSTDAVNGSQLYATNQNVAANTANITDLDSRVTTVDNRVTSIDGRVTNVEGSVTNLTQQLDSGSVGLVQQDATSKAITVAKGLDGTMVDFTGTEGVRALGGVKAGALSDTSTEAVNGSQLHATNQNVTANTTNIASNTTAITSLDSRVTNVEGSVTNLTQQLDGGSVGLVQQDATSKAITVAKGLDGTMVDFTGTEGVRALSGVKAGALSDTSTEAVNGSQLHATNQNVTANTTNITDLDSRVTTVDNRVTSIDGRVTNVEGSVTNLTQQLDSGSVGVVQQDATSKAITVAKDLDGTMVDFTGTDGVRSLGGVKAGALSDTSTEAVNGSQLHATNQNVTANTTSIASNTTAITSLDSRVSTVDDRVTSIDGRVTNVEGSVTNLTQQLDSGSVGLVQQDATSKAITVAKGLDGTTVDFTGANGVRSLGGVKAGALSDTSTEAVNGSQLHATNQNVTANTTNITDLDSRVTTVDDRVTSIDGRVTNVEGSVTNLTQQLDSGSVGLVQQDATSKAITVAKGLDGTTVDFTGANGVRSLGGVKAGALSDTSNEAVNGSQLHATNQNVTANTTNIASNTTAITSLDSRVSTVDDRVTSIDGRVTNVEGSVTNLTQQLDSGSVGLVQQDATSKAITVAKGLDGTTVDFTGANGVRSLGGVKAGALSDTSTEAVNGSQLHATNQNVTANTTNITDLDSRVTTVDDRVTSIDGRVTNVEGSVTNLTQQLDSGSVGLVQQDATSKAITVAKGLDGTTVDFTGANGVRSLGGVKAGALSDTSNEAVNGSQLHATNQNVTANTTNIASNTTAITSLDSRVSTVDDRVTSIDGRVTNVEGSVTNLTQQLDSGSVGLVQQDATSKAITVAKGLDGTTVDFTGANGVRSLGGVKAGALSDTSTEAVNGSQLHATNQNVTANTTNITDLDSRVTTVDDRVTSIDGRVTNVEGSVTNLTQQLDGGSVGLVQQDSTSKAITVARDLDGTTVDFTGANGVRTLGGVKAGALSDTSTEVVNGSQLHATNQAIANASRYFKAGGLEDGTDDAIAAAKSVAVGAGASANVGSAATANWNNPLVSGNGSNTDINGVAIGANSRASLGGIALGDTAVSDSYSGVALGAYTVAGSHGTAVGAGAMAEGADSSALGYNALATGGSAAAMGNFSTASGDKSAALGAKANAQAANSVALGADSIADRDDAVSVGNATLKRQITNVAAGTLSASSTDAVNGSQLYGTASSVAQALGGGSTVNPDGTISAPSYSVGGTTVHSISDAVTNIDGRTTQNASDIEQNTATITNVQNRLADGSVGLVQQDATTRDITVAKDTDGTVVNMAGTAGDRTVTGVAAGAVNASSVDAVNGGQLYGTASSMAQALGGGSTMNADGTISAPSYSVGGTTVHSVGDAVTNLDDRVTQNTTDITKLQTQVGDVGTQLSGAVQYDRNVDGSVNFGSVTLGGGLGAGPVILTNVANGTSQYDAVNFGQLSTLQDQVTDLNGQVKDLGSQVSNIQPVTPDVSSPDRNTDEVANAATPGTGVGSTVAGANASATADNAVAVGTNAAATGVNSTAIGTGSQAGNANSVALGQGSVTDRDNSVSVGSAGHERQITNVAAGTADTDAVNVGQMNSSVAQGVQQANNYTDQRINATNQAINDVAKNAYAGIAAAMAMPNMTPSGPGKTIVAAGGATYKGGSAAAVGATYRSRNNKWLVNAAMSVTSTGDAGVRAQVGYEF
ncbi:autotransporter adhesin [Paraburkholderia sp. WSM4175]|uniref:ESPR-type extended signal peptide-containing protein n=1 Tax=Paraburkholderia sp. WSM4175 TaxID=2991072 RepID=UPI003D214D86